MNFKPITRRQILDGSKLKQSADDNLKFDENSRKVFKWIENIVSKGEIARYEQFLLFPQCFQKTCFPGASKGVIVWESVNKDTGRLNAYICIENLTNHLKDHENDFSDRWFTLILIIQHKYIQGL